MMLEEGKDSDSQEMTLYNKVFKSLANVCHLIIMNNNL